MTQPQDTGAVPSIDSILEQAYTDGASDTMWQDDRHVEIFQTAKSQLEALIQQETLEARIDELETLSWHKEHPPEHSGNPNRGSYPMAERIAELKRQQTEAMKGEK